MVGEQFKLIPPLMSATDDAQVRPVVSGQRRPTAPSRRLASVLLGAFTCAVSAGAVLTTPTLLPDVPRYVCRVATSAGWTEVRASSEDGARLAAARLASGPETEAMAARRRLADGRANWADMPPGPLAPLARETETAALLRARADLGVTLAGEGAVTAPPQPPGIDATALELADRAVERAVLAGDPEALREALKSADRAEQRWLASESVASERMARWQSRERGRAERFVLAAQVLESTATPLQRDLVTQWVPEFALDLEPSALATLESAVRSSGRTEPRPFTLLWMSVLLFAAATGAVIGYALERAFVRPPRAALGRPLARASDPEFTNAARLHVVSGESANDIAAGVAQIAAPFIARGERVVLLDGGRALKLHAPFGAQPSWGLGECAAEETRLLGVVQRALVNGLYLLPRGAEKRALWPAAGRVLDEALSHFARVILAVDVAGAPPAAEALRGRWIEGWWAGRGRRTLRGATAISGRLGIAMQTFELKLSAEALREELPALIESLRASLPLETLVVRAQVREPVAAARHAGPAVAALAATVASEVGATAAPAGFAPQAETTRPEPLSPHVAHVVATDVATRERLRFLMWMRRVQAERRKREMPSVA